MKEVVGNIWDSEADFICVTTNGVLNSKGNLVMGKGIALQAAKMYPILPTILGKHVKYHGNIPRIVPLENDTHLGIINLPTKHHWRNPSDINLIIDSIKQISKMVNPDNSIAMTRPGCGNGGLDWNYVKPKVEQHLDDRFTIWRPQSKN